MASDQASAEANNSAVEHAKTMLRPLFDVMGIQRIFVVDDELSTALDLPDIIGAIKSKLIKGDGDDITKIASMKSLAIKAPEEIWRPQIEGIWAKLQPTDRQSLASDLGVVTEPEGDGRGVLGELLSDYELTFMTLAQWRADRDVIMREAATRPSLFLFDQDMQKNEGSDTEGMKLISGLLRARPALETVYCGLFTNRVTADTEHKSHSDFVEAFKLEAERNRFAVISKDHLREQPGSLAVRLKRVAISPWCEKLKHQLVNAVKDAVDDAAAKVERLDIYDFEQIVFQSSYKEGVSESDTLFRLFGLFHQEATRTKAKNDSVLTAAADKVRSVISLPYRPADRKGTQVRDITRLELYENDEYLISHKIPIECGDIFQKKSGTKQYMLLEQPCDLMVRGDDGKRNAELVVLAEMYQQPRDVKREDDKVAKNPSAYVELEYYGDDDANQYFVHLARCHTVSACLLDLCVYSKDGSAEIKIGDKCPSGMIHAWKLRYDLIHAEAESVVSTFKRFTANGAAETAEEMKRFLQKSMTKSGDLVKGEIKFTPDRVQYNVKRVRRLKSPRAGSILRELAYFKSRDAFDHDLMRNLEKEACRAGEAVT